MVFCNLEVDLIRLRSSVNVVAAEKLPDSNTSYSSPIPLPSEIGFVKVNTNATFLDGVTGLAYILSNL